MKHTEQTEVTFRQFEGFGNYVFLKRLAMGGMAEVFLARPASQSGNGRIQIVKRILPHVASNSMFLDMFKTEIQVIMGFNHAHTVQLHDSGEINGQPYIAMEYIEGKDLKQVVAKFAANKKKIPVPMALSLISQAAAGLNYAHTFTNSVTGEVVNAIHRDITPHNLIVSYEGNLKVIDFGIAKAACSMHEATQAGTIKGKIAYLSPEQINGQAVDARTDVFALGIVAWELLTLQRLFLLIGDSEITTMSRIIKCDESVLPPSTINKDVPPEVDEVIMKALKKNPDERYASAKEFQVALRAVMQKFYPEYSYSNNGQIISELFADEITKERSEIRILNQQAQHALQTPNSTAIVRNENSVPGIISGIRAIVPGLDPVDQRLKSIEAMVKQKATSRHYMMLAFYIISIIMLKMNDQYDFFTPSESKQVSQNTEISNTNKSYRQPASQNKKKSVQANKHR